MANESDSDIEVIALYIYNKRRKNKKRTHEYWVHELLQERGRFGEYQHLVKQLFSYEDKFFIYFRMLPQTFHDIHELLKDDLTKEKTFWRTPIGTEERLTICLRFLATGDSYSTIGFSYRVGIKTVSRIVNETCEALWNRLQPQYMPTPYSQLWQVVAEGYLQNWQFPNCLGALDENTWLSLHRNAQVLSSSIIKIHFRWCCSPWWTLDIAS